MASIIHPSIDNSLYLLPKDHPRYVSALKKWEDLYLAAVEVDTDSRHSDQEPESE